MVSPLPDRYISLLTDFGFKRVFGTEPNKALLLDFLNTLLPEHHRIAELTFKTTENLGQTPIESLRDGKAERKAIFDIYCQAANGERFIVEIQKAKQNFFKDRSVYYSTFPIQEQALKGEWDYKLASVYTVGVLDFVFDDHKDEDTLVHVVELKNQHCEVFYDKLKFIYIQLPKFKKSLDELETHLDKWLYLLQHLAELSNPPSPLQETVFSKLFEVAEIANFSPTEQQTYQNSLKYYRDMNNVVDTSREEGRIEGKEEGRIEGKEEGRVEGRLTERSLMLDRQRTMLLRLLPRAVGKVPDDLQAAINQLSLENLEALNEIFLDFTSLDDLVNWLSNYRN